MAQRDANFRINTQQQQQTLDLAASAAADEAVERARLAQELLDDKRVKQLLQPPRRLQEPSGILSDLLARNRWMPLLLGALVASMFLLAFAFAIHAFLLWHERNASHAFEDSPSTSSSSSPGSVIPFSSKRRFADSSTSGANVRVLPVDPSWRGSASQCPWRSPSDWLQELTLRDPVWSRLLDRCVSTFEGLHLEHCADLPPDASCDTAIERAFWRFSLAWVPGSGDRGRYAERVVVPELYAVLLGRGERELPPPQVVLVPDDCEATRGLFDRAELTYLLDAHPTFCEIASQVLLRHAAQLVSGSDACRRARLENVLRPEARLEDDGDRLTVYVPSMLFSTPALFPDPAVDMARAYAGGPVLIASAMASALGLPDPDLCALNATLELLRRHASVTPQPLVGQKQQQQPQQQSTNAEGTWPDNFLIRASHFLDCRDGTHRADHTAASVSRYREILFGDGR